MATWMKPFSKLLLFRSVNIAEDVSVRTMNNVISQISNLLFAVNVESVPLSSTQIAKLQIWTEKRLKVLF